MIPLGPVVARARVRAEREVVWNYLVDPGLRASWWPEVNLDAQLGGEISERWSDGEGEDTITRDARGSIDVWVAGHAFGFKWCDANDERSTAVLITLRSQGVDTGLTVTETGFDGLPTPAERSAASLDGWQSLLADLVAAVDAGAGEATLVAVAPAVDADAETADADVETDADALEAETLEVEVVEVEAVMVEAVETEILDAELADADTHVADVDADEAESADVEECEVPLIEPFVSENEPSEDENVVPLVLPGPPNVSELFSEPAQSADGDAAAAGDAENLAPTVKIELPMVEGVAVEDETAEAAEEATEEVVEDQDSFTGDPDFDALIRGDRL